MGYVDGKTDADLLVEEIDIEEDYERVVVLQVSYFSLSLSLSLSYPFIFCLLCCSVCLHSLCNLFMFCSSFFFHAVLLRRNG